MIGTNFISEQRLELGPWQALERLISRSLSHMGFEDVELVGGPGEQGADVVATRQNERWVFQSKYQATGSIGEKALKETFNAMNAYDAKHGVAVTNQYFGPSAVKFKRLKCDSGWNMHLWDKDRLLHLGSKLPEESMAQRAPREYQREAIDVILDSITNGEDHGLITLATGLGKTMVGMSIIREYISENPNALILVMAHTNDLVKQLELSSWSQFDKYTHTHIWGDNEEPAFYSGVVFATWQSIASFIQNGGKLKNKFNFVMVDEAHHAPSKHFSWAINYLNPQYLLGVTATPWRSDGLNLRDLFGDPKFSMSVVEGMQKGFLSEVDYEMLTDGIDWSEIELASQKGLSVRDLNKLLYVPERDDGLVRRIYNEIKKISAPRVLVFCPTIDYAERLLRFFRTYDINAATIHGKLHRTERFKTLSDFRTGKLEVLLSVELLNEGIDVPEVNLVCFARVTHSRRIFLQQLGRGLRLTDDKKTVKVLDFVADIRRIAAGMEMNEEAKTRSTEEVRYKNGNIVKFSSEAEGFFKEYLADMSNLSDLDETARLEFPEV